MTSHLKLILSKKLHEFCEHCTLHGAYYLQKGRGTCVAWGLIMLSGFALWGVLGHMIWEKYSSDPTVTVVESTYYRSDQIPFPSLMICDPLLVYGPNTKTVTNILFPKDEELKREWIRRVNQPNWTLSIYSHICSRHFSAKDFLPNDQIKWRRLNVDALPTYTACETLSRGYTASQIDEYYDSFLTIREDNYAPPAYLRKMHSLLQDLGFTLEISIEMVKKPCNVTLVKCRWRSVEYNCSEMFLEVVTVVGHCCHFDIDEFKKFAPSNTKFVPGATIAEGLELTLDGVKAYPNGTVQAGAILMYIFDARNKVTMMDSPISLAASSYFNVGIEMISIDSSPEVKALPLKTRKCALDTDRGLGASFYQKCISTLVMRKVVNSCKCLPFMYFEITFADMHSLIRTNDCYQNCDYIEYDPIVEFIRRLEPANNKNYTEISLHYASNTCMKYRREVIYTWDQMLANLGGIFGLCLGGSIISVIEILWFLIDLLVTTINSFKGKRKPSKKKTIVVMEKDTKKHDKNEVGCYKFAN